MVAEVRKGLDVVEMGLLLDVVPNGLNGEVAGWHDGAGSDDLTDREFWRRWDGAGCCVDVAVEASGSAGRRHCGIEVVIEKDVD